MKPRTNCKSCMSPHRSYIEDELSSGTAVAAIIRGLAERGETFSQANITAHKKNHWRPFDPTDQDREQIIRELEAEMRMSPPTVAAAYLVLIEQLHSLKTVKPSPDSVFKAAATISAITGMRTKQQLLLAYADKAFSNKQGTTELPAPLLMDTEESEL